MNKSQSFIYVRSHLQNAVCSLCLSQNRKFVKNMAVVLRIQEDFPTLLQYYNVNEDRICWECNAQLRKFIRFHNQVQLARVMLNKISDCAGAGYLPKINSMSRLSRSKLRGVVHIVPMESMLGGRGILPKENDTIPTNVTLPMPSMPWNPRIPPNGNETIPPSSMNVTIPMPRMPRITLKRGEIITPSVNVTMNATVPQTCTAASDEINISNEMKPIITSVSSLSQSSVPGVNIEPISTYPPYECQTDVSHSIKLEVEEIILKERDTSESDSCPDIKEELEDELPNQNQNKAFGLDQIQTSTYVQKPPILSSNSPEYNLPVRNTIPLNTEQNTSILEQNETVPVRTSSNQMTVTSGSSNVDPTGVNNYMRITIQSKSRVMELREKERFYLSNMKTGFNCDKCIVNIQNEEVYKKHMARHDPSAGPEVCDICEMRFPNKDALSLHYNSHFSAFTCNRCRKATFVCRLWSTMQTHLRIHDFPGWAACGECGAAFENQQLLKEHTDAMHLLKCPKCKVKVKSQARVERHIYNMHTEVKCEKCNLTIKGMKSLKYHKRTSKVCYGDPGDGVVIAGEDGSCQAYCAKCDKFFKNTYFLKQHMKTTLQHAGARFECDYCGKAYAWKGSLIAHINITHNKKRLPCSRCGKDFARERTLKRHVLFVHSKTKLEPKHTCGVCGKMFMTKALLNKHLLIHSGVRPFQCKLCPWNFTQSGTLYTHMRLKHKIGKKTKRKAVNEKVGKKVKSASVKQKTGKKARSKAVKQKARRDGETAGS